MSLARIAAPIVVSLVALTAHADEPGLRQVQVTVGEPTAIELNDVALAGDCADPTIARIAFGADAKSVRATGLRSGITRCTFVDETNHKIAIEVVVSEPGLDTP